jgi:hypothetical protein
VTSRDLIDMAHGPRGRDSVVVPVHDVERTVPLRSTRSIGRRDALGLNLRSLDDVIDAGDVHTSSRGQRTFGGRSGARGFDTDRVTYDDANYDRSDFDSAGSATSSYDTGGYDRDSFARSDYDSSTAGYHRAGRAGLGYHQANVSWDAGDVSYSRSRCGRHRA